MVKTIGGVANTLEFDFAAKEIANTVGDIDFIEPPGGGIGHCSTDATMKVNVTLLGAGNVKSVATTTSPASVNTFRAPIGRKRIDAGILKPATIVNIYSNRSPLYQVWLCCRVRPFLPPKIQQLTIST